MIMESVPYPLDLQETPGFSLWTVHKQGPGFGIVDQVDPMEYGTVDPVEVTSAYAPGMNFVIALCVCHADFFVPPAQYQGDRPVPGMIV